MENTNARRGFLKGFGLLSAAAGGFLASQTSFANTPSPTPIGSAAVTERDIGPVEDIAHLAPLGKTTLQLTADNIPPPPPPPPQPAPVGGYGCDGCMITGSSNLSILNDGNKETDNRVTLSVGKDNRLWIKIGDTWRRVALEG
jgi:hypothetical protein